MARNAEVRSPMITKQKAIQIHGEPVGRSLRKAYTAASKPSWEDTGREFHKNYRLDRFTHRHATEANYGERKKKYTMQKLRKYGHTRPLEKSGEAKKLSASARIVARGGSGASKEVIVSVGHLTHVTNVEDRGGVRVVYASLRKLNFRHPMSDINMADEFRRITDRESLSLGNFFASKFKPRFEQGINK